MQNRQQLTGYVLHKRHYRETSMLVDFFSFEFGRVSAVAKGARGNSKSDRKSLLQPFQKLEFELVGRSQLKNLGRIEALQSALSITQSGLYCGFYVNEILSRALHVEEAVEEVFTHYEKTLSLLASVKNNDLSELEPILREFELTLLLALGYLPDFSVDAKSGEPINPSSFYHFQAQEGFTCCHSQNQHAIKGEYLLAIAQGDYDGSSNGGKNGISSNSDSNENNAGNGSTHQVGIKKAAKYICRLALVELIGDKPIKSRELFR